MLLANSVIKSRTAAPVNFNGAGRFQAGAQHSAQGGLR